jgi:uncharacterized protein YbaA (DUF1428 family)
MSYVDGFVAAVPRAGKEAYVDFARRAWALFRAHGALRNVEAWEDDVPDGEKTSFPIAVQRGADEVVVFSWIEWPDRATRDACFARMQDDPEFAALGDMPMDGSRMIFGGFVPVLDERA